MNIQEYKEIRKEKGKEAGKALLFFFVYVPIGIFVMVSLLML